MLSSYPTTLSAAAKTTAMLTESREQELFSAYREKGDHGARNSIAIAHLRLVIGEAGRFARYNIPADELITEGNIAIMQAIESFDPARGVRFCAYARHWVRSAIMAYVIKSRSLVTISGTKANKRLFFKLERARSALAASHKGRLPENADSLIAEALGVTKTALQDMSVRLSGDHSLDATSEPDDQNSFLESLASDEDDPEEALMKTQARTEAIKAMTTLTDRERHILLARVFTDSDAVPELSELAASFGVTPQRVHQIEKKALTKLRAVLLEKIG